MFLWLLFIFLKIHRSIVFRTGKLGSIRLVWITGIAQEHRYVRKLTKVIAFESMKTLSHIVFQKPLFRF